MTYYCPSCGTEIEKGIDGLCVECYFSKNHLITLPDIIRIEYCPRCDSYRVGSSWISKNRDEIIEEVLSRYVHLPDLISDPDLRFHYIKEDTWSNTVIVTCSAHLASKEIRGERQTEIRFIPKVCETCSRQAGSYYESIVQLRADSRKLLDSEIDTFIEIVENIVDKERASGNRMAFISRWIRRSEGVDVYLSSRALGKKIARKIRESMGGKILESKSISGRKDGKDLFRFTYSVRLPSYTAGDLIKTEKSIAVITKNGKGIDLMTGQEIKLHRASVKVIGNIRTAKKTFVVDVDRYAIQIIHPETQHIITVEKPLIRVQPGDEISVVETTSGIIIVPEGLLG